MVESLRKARANPKLEASSPKKNALNSVLPVWQILSISIPFTAPCGLVQERPGEQNKDRKLMAAS